VFPVLDADARLAGIITLEDLTALAAEPDLDELIRATDVMRRPVSLRPHELVNRALDSMTSLGVRELPVIDADQRLLGMIEETAIAHEYMRARAAERAEAAAGPRANEARSTT
jgi:CBS domain-containing protein